MELLTIKNYPHTLGASVSKMGQSEIFFLILVSEATYLTIVELTLHFKYLISFFKYIY